MRLNDTFRFNGTHRKGCGARFSTLASFQYVAGRMDANRRATGYFWRGDDGREFECARNGNHALEYACACGKLLYARPVIGRYQADKKCDGRCLSATGHSCECQCGGKNHGAGVSVSG